MRARFRTHLIDVVLYLLGLIVIAELWLGLDWNNITVTVLIGGVLVLAAAKQWMAIAARHRARRIEEAATAARARVSAEVSAAIADGLNATIVEVVAAQQAVVRGAYADDILTRLNAADESAHAALSTLDRLAQLGHEDPTPVEPELTSA